MKTNKNTKTSFTIPADLKRELDSAFERVFPEVAAMERLEKEKGKITEEDLKKIFS